MLSSNGKASCLVWVGNLFILTVFVKKAKLSSNGKASYLVWVGTPFIFNSPLREGNAV